MKRFFRFLLCCVISLSAVFVSGYGNVMNDISESLAVMTFIGGVLVIALIIFAILEIYLSLKNKIRELSARIEELEKDDNTSDQE